MCVDVQRILGPCRLDSFYLKPSCRGDSSFGGEVFSSLPTCLSEFQPKNDIEIFENKGYCFCVCVCVVFFLCLFLRCLKKIEIILIQPAICLCHASTNPALVGCSLGGFSISQAQYNGELLFAFFHQVRGL